MPEVQIHPIGASPCAFDEEALSRFEVDGDVRPATPEVTVEVLPRR
jgi:hypothetical protein